MAHLPHYGNTAALVGTAILAAVMVTVVIGVLVRRPPRSRRRRPFSRRGRR